jgi:hypothetical protein
VRPQRGLLVVLTCLAMWAGTAGEARAAGRTRSPDAAATAALLRSLRAVNYYPRRHAWSGMWTHWAPRTLAADFARIRGLHANAVRLIVHPYAFGYPDPSPVMVGRLADAVRLARAHGLRVQLTLFDLWSEFSDLEGSRRWAEQVLAPLAGDPDVATIELLNEIDPRSPAEIAWARAMLPLVRADGGGIPVTVSLAGDQGAEGLRALKAGLGPSQPDYFDLHVYRGRWGEGAYATLRAAKAAVAPVPLYVGESGADTTAGPAAEFDQDHALRAVEWAVRRLGLGAASPWTLYDFAPGAIPFAAEPLQYRMGLFTTAGRAKPAARGIRAAFAGGPVDASFNNSFETGYAADGGSLPAEWGRWRGELASMARVTDVARTGAASVRIQAAGGDAEGVPAFFTSPVAAELVPGRRYRASAWLRGRGVTGRDGVGLAWFGADGGYLGQSLSPPLPPGASDWTRVEVTAAAPPGASHVQIHLMSAQNAGTVWFDDVAFGPA